jgi:hypothetical protein
VSAGVRPRSSLRRGSRQAAQHQPRGERCGHPGQAARRVELADEAERELLGIQLEERDLMAQFGSQYRSYRERVNMLLPAPARSRAAEPTPRTEATLT